MNTERTSVVTGPSPIPTVAMNEALLISGLRQHELREEAEKFNAQLQEKMAEVERTAGALRQSEERFRALYGALPVAAFVCDRNAVIQNYNPRAVELWGREPEIGVEKHCGSMKLWLPNGTLLPHAQSPMMEVLRTGTACRNVELFIERPDGSRLPVTVNFCALRNAQGEVEGAVASFDDITERKKNEEALHDAVERLAMADRQKDEFMAVLAHELRNPLAPIKSAAQVLRLARIDDPTVIRAQGIIERQANHMIRLVDDLLDISRLQNGKVRLQRENVNLSVAVSNALESCRPFIMAQNHEVTLNVQRTPPVYFDADPARVEQIVGNIISNAAKYTPPNGRIQVSAAAENGMAVIRVKDNGAGIEPSMLGRVFDVYTQVVQSLERSQGGLGLGLKLVRELVRLHGGTVEAKSEGLGKGSEFIVRFPQVAEAPVAEVVPEKSSRSTPRRILLVEDNPDIRDAMEMLLTMNGHTLEMAVDGREGVEKALASARDLCLIDIGLPIFNGYEVAKKIRAQSGGDKIVLIALTGYGKAEDKQKAHEAGFDDHLTKPVDAEYLIALLNNLEKYQRTKV